MTDDVSGAPVRLVFHAAGFADIVLNRPQTANALSVAVCAAIADALARAVADGARVVLLRSEGKHFCGGADIHEMRSMSAQAARQADFSGCCDAVAACPIPVIALAHGGVIGGGCELVEMCDVVIAARSARFSHPEITLGLMPGAGGTQRLPRLVGYQNAQRMLLTGAAVDALEAQRMGLASVVVEDHDLVDVGHRMASRIASFPANALRRLKQAARAAMELPLGEGLRLERRLFHDTFGEPDNIEGLAAFAEKRQPWFNQA